jgi:hypothetical protein
MPREELPIAVTICLIVCGIILMPIFGGLTLHAALEAHNLAEFPCVMDPSVPPSFDQGISSKYVHTTYGALANVSSSGPPLRVRLHVPHVLRYHALFEATVTDANSEISARASIPFTCFVRLGDAQGVAILPSLASPITLAAFGILCVLAVLALIGYALWAISRDAFRGWQQRRRWRRDVPQSAPSAPRFVGHVGGPQRGPADHEVELGVRM